MALIPYIELSEASPEVQDGFKKFAKATNLFRMIAHAEGVFMPSMRFSYAILTKMTLDPALREMAILLVATLAKCPYEFEQHELIVTSLELFSPAKVAAIKALKLQDPVFSDTEKLVLKFSRQAVEDVKPEPELTLRVRDLFGSRGLLELLFCVGQYMMLARIIEATEIDMDELTDLATIRKAYKLDPQ